LLLSLPFLIQDLPIWFHRLWQVALWLGLSGIGGFLLAKRIRVKPYLLFIAFAAWSFITLNIGPVYYHLVLCVILIYWGVDFNKPLRTAVILILSSVWAGLSRINWVPVPAFLVVVLYLMEQAWDKHKQGLKYFIQPVLYGLGAGAGLLSYTAYLNLSGNEANKFGSSFTSDLLWNRLLPNPTFPMGILFGVVVISFPMWFILVWRYRETRGRISPIKWLIYTGILLLLLAGGLVVSVKIGGGSNLHNMDAYLVLLMTITAYMYWKRDVIDDKREIINLRKIIPEWISAFVILVPIMLTIREGWVISYPDSARDEADLINLQQEVMQSNSAGRDVLFIAERQVQVFNQDMGVPLVPDYEKMELMEMVMAGNQAYLDRFYDDLMNHRFSLIILDAIRIDWRDRSGAFSEEHNMWVEKVILPVLKHYEYTPLGERRNINLLTPKESG
jgi:hypothetical protein